MAKFLQNLLGAKEPLFTAALHNLERAAGHSGVDARLIGDIIRKSHDVMREIGLDPADTTGMELYNALKSHASRQDLFNDTDYIGVIFAGDVISMNKSDIEENKGVSYEQRTTRYLQRSLQQELVARYNNHARTDELAVRQFARDAGIDVEGGAAEIPQPPAAKESTLGRPYILSIGDIFTDAFIKLREDKARIDTDPDGSKRLSMEFGSKPPYERVDIVQAVGPSPNAAVAFARLGLNSGLMAYLGDDLPGKDSISYLKSEGIDTTAVAQQKDMKSNYYFVLRYGADRTILVKNEDYDYSWQLPSRKPDWIYLALVSGSAWQLHEDLLIYLDKNPDIKLAFQPGTFHFEWGAKKLAKIYKRSYLVVMNREEAALVTGKNVASIADLASALHELGPKTVIITDGPDGAYASDRSKIIKMPNYPDPAPPVDRTGAGDAFASTLVAALALGESLETALRWAPINSMSVVQKLGAQAGLLRPDELKQYLRDAPDDFVAEEI